MAEQTLNHTHAMYDKFMALAEFIEHQATEDEVKAFMEIMGPLNLALAKRMKEFEDGET